MKKEEWRRDCMERTTWVKREMVEEHVVEQVEPVEKRGGEDEAPWNSSTIDRFSLFYVGYYFDNSGMK